MNVIVVAHPDDEVALFGWRLTVHPPDRIIHLTDGAPRDGHDAARHGLSIEAYAAQRQVELRKALDLAGVDPRCAIGLEIPDRELASHIGQAISALRVLLAEATEIWTHSWEGGHPDHDAARYCVARAAPPGALILEAPGYHMGPAGVVVGRYPDATFERVHTLTASERAHKRALLNCFETQLETLRYWCHLDEEHLRMARPVDWDQPPGPHLLYEVMGWARFATLRASLAGAG